VDIDKKSDESNIIGLELHLLRKSSESNSLVLAPIKLGTFQKERLPQRWKHVGDIKVNAVGVVTDVSQNLGGFTSMGWAFSLYQVALDTFVTLAANGNEWSASVNCQQFVRKLL
jgi:hypothetical protein